MSAKELKYLNIHKFSYNYRITLYSETWNREVCELIDYDSPNINREKTEIRSSGYLYRTNEDTILFQNKINPENDQHLLDIKYEEGKFDLFFNDFEQDEDGLITSKNSAWFLLKKSKLEPQYDKYKIHQGEIIKIGRIMTRIKDIKFTKKESLDNNDKNVTKYVTTTENIEIKSELSDLSQNSNKFELKNIDNDHIIKNGENQLTTEAQEQLQDTVIKRNKTKTDLPEKVQILTLQNNMNGNKAKNINKSKFAFNVNPKTNEKICRICYGEEDDPKENPIVQPCRCSGSCKYIHLQCLKHWIMTKSCVKIDDSEYCCVFIFSETECELCKAKLPDLVEHNKKLYSLLDFSNEFKNYLILECLTLDKENNKFLYVISLEKKGDIKIGRGQICDILFSDASVSRIHCVLSVEGRSVYLKDYGSKFGTLILVQAPVINLTENLPLFIQIGRSYLNFLATDANPKFFSCCGVSETPMVSYYYQQNQKQIRDNRIFTVKNEVNNNDSQEFLEEKKEDVNNNSWIKNAENNSNSEDNIQEIDNKEEKRGEIYEEINEDIII